MRYYGAVIRPPSEASSLIVQVSFGCSNASCDFCSTYLDKPFAVRPPAEVVEDVTGLPDSIKARVRRAFWPTATPWRCRAAGSRTCWPCCAASCPPSNG